MTAIELIEALDALGQKGADLPVMVWAEGRWQEVDDVRDDDDRALMVLRFVDE